MPTSRRSPTKRLSNSVRLTDTINHDEREAREDKTTFPFVVIVSFADIAVMP